MEFTPMTCEDGCSLLAQTYRNEQDTAGCIVPISFTQFQKRLGWDEVKDVEFGVV
jgi:hypothetical protein